MILIIGVVVLMHCDQHHHYQYVLLVMLGMRSDGYHHYHHRDHTSLSFLVYVSSVPLGTVWHAGMRSHLHPDGCVFGIVSSVASDPRRATFLWLAVVVPKWKLDFHGKSCRFWHVRVSQGTQVVVQWSQIGSRLLKVLLRSGLCAEAAVSLHCGMLSFFLRFLGEPNFLKLFGNTQLFRARLLPAHVSTSLGRGLYQGSQKISQSPASVFKEYTRPLLTTHIPCYATSWSPSSFMRSAVMTLS